MRDGSHTATDARSRRIRWGCVAIAVVLVVTATATAGVAAQSDDGIGLSLDPVRDTVGPGETVQIGVTVENAGDAVAPATVLRLGSLPDGWTLESWSGTDAAFRNSTNEWLWTAVDPDETLKFTVVVAVPSDAAGEGTVAGTLSDGTDREASASATIRVREGDATTTPTDADSGGGAPVGSDARSGLERLRTSVETPGFGPVPALLGLLLTAAALATRRRK